MAARKDIIKNEFLKLLENATSHAEVDVIENTLRPLKPTLAALQLTHTVLEEHQQLDMEIRKNKNIIPQQRFFPTKKNKNSS